MRLAGHSIVPQSRHASYAKHKIDFVRTFGLLAAIFFCTWFWKAVGIPAVHGFIAYLGTLLAQLNDITTYQSGRGRLF